MVEAAEVAALEGDEAGQPGADAVLEPRVGRLDGPAHRRDLALGRQGLEAQQVDDGVVLHQQVDGVEDAGLAVEEQVDLLRGEAPQALAQPAGCRIHLFQVAA